MLIAGMPCIPWSSRGNGMGSIGAEPVAFMTLMHENYHKLYDIVVLEFTSRFCEEHLKLMLGDRYCVLAAVFSPHQLGRPVLRSRKYMVLLNNSTWRWRPGHELSAGKLLALFGGDVQLTGSVFLENTSKEAVRTFISKLCKKRHIHDKDARGKR